MHVHPFIDAYTSARSPQNLRRKKSAPQISSLVRQPFSEEKPKTLKADCGALCPPGFTPLHAISRHFHRRTALARDPAEIINKLDRCWWSKLCPPRSVKTASSASHRRGEKSENLRKMRRAKKRIQTDKINARIADTSGPWGIPHGIVYKMRYIWTKVRVLHRKMDSIKNTRFKKIN